MTAKKYADKNYPTQSTWATIAEVAFKAGYKACLKNSKSKYVKNMESEFKELREYKKQIEEIISDQDKLLKQIAGI